ncbi:MAG TPA: Fur family transcriptional regulator [Nocardioides sp.]|nr:Fur family transcriptional regulator [Nocardioides sp.]
MATGEARLRAVGVRVTPQRLAVLAVLDRARREGAHLLATEVTERSREILGRVSTQTVYDCLDALVSAGLVRRVALPDGPVRFESSSGPDHHHLVCSRCGRIRNVPGAPAAPNPELVERCGFDVGYAETVHVGLCRTCRED